MPNDYYIFFYYYYYETTLTLHLSKSVNSVIMQVMDTVSHIVITFLSLMNINAQP